MINLHKLYYKDYFSGIDFSSITKKEMIEEKKKQRKEFESQNDPVTKNVKIPNLDTEIMSLGADLERMTNCNKQSVSERNKVLIAENYTEEILENCNPPQIYEENKEQAKPIELEIQYPGLVTGVGIDHEAKIEGEFKLGVHFDWTRGMPVIYGSSVKGVLRSWFKEFYEDDLDTGDLIMDIFEGAYDRDVEVEKKKYGDNWEEKVKKTDNRIYKKRKSIYERDIFFDAVVKTPDKKGRILCSDSITPHGDNPLKNPTPLTFLKIASGCTLEFRFKLTDSDFGDDKKFTAAQKKTLFEEILKTVGVGAKTNVGYGQLKEAK